MAQITFYKHDPIPLEMHKVRIVQKLNLLPAAAGKGPGVRFQYLPASQQRHLPGYAY